MIRIARDWATPLTIGVFALMAVTGLLMFFHLDSALQKVAHEWLGWLMVVAAAAHATANWAGFKRHLQLRGQAPVILSACAVALAISFVVALPGESGASPPVLALRAIGKAPLKDVAPLAGKPVDQIRRELAAAGIRVDSDDQSLERAVAGDREQLGRALRVLFQPDQPPG